MQEGAASHDHGMLYHLILAITLLIALVFYLIAVAKSNRRFKIWPLYRSFFWFFGILSAGIAMFGSSIAHTRYSFTFHMVSHLLLGMLAPLLLALASPVTLILRTSNVKSSRRLSRILKSWPIRIVNNPAAASLLNTGGLYVLYMTGLYMKTQQFFTLHVWVHLHIFLAGYFFIVSIIYIDPAPHRSSFVYRAGVLLIALTMHNVLAKYIYAHPPAGVIPMQAEQAGMLMYYGGDVIHVALILIFFLQWFKASRSGRTAAGLRYLSNL